ncbi:MAG TPA: hypothetical protein VG734_06225 [Lacunisphaera sp.]|nr:hypothetical protein [Lacunisphaera sp.]
MAAPGSWVFLLVGLAAFLVFLHGHVSVYSRTTGITQLLRVGREFDDAGLAVFRATPKQIDSPLGFDGQFYAEMALDPLLRDPHLREAIDSAEYRGRRILMPWLAWLGGWGRPFWILNVYAALNLVFWVGFAVMMGRLFRPHGWAGLAGFTAMLMTCGIIESMRSSLTDFPSFVVMTLAMMIGGKGGAGVLALAALIREASVISVVALWRYRPPWLKAARHNLALGLIAALPLVLWSVYVHLRLADPVARGAGGNFAWPLQGMVAKLGEFSVAAVDGTIDWRDWYTEFYASEALHAVLTIVSVLTQIVYLLTHRNWDNLIWRTGACFIPYFLCISHVSWESHFTITRHALAITLAFNLILAMRPGRAWLAWFLLGNCFVPYGIHLFKVQHMGSGTYTVMGPAPEAAYKVVPARPTDPALSVRFEKGWWMLEWNRLHSWHWSTAERASLTVVNPTERPARVRLAFFLRSKTVRDLSISVRGAEIWATPALQAEQSVETPTFLIPPGATVVDFETRVPPLQPTGSEIRPLTFMLKDVEIRLSPAPPDG